MMGLYGGKRMNFEPARAVRRRIDKKDSQHKQK